MFQGKKEKGKKIISSFPFTHHFWHVFATEEYMEGDQLGDQRAATVSRVLDGVESRRKVCSRGVHRNRYRGPPSFQQRFQIIQKRVIRVRGVRHTLPASHRHAHRHIIVQDPVITPLRPSWFHRLFVARHSFLQAHRRLNHRRVALHLNEKTNG